MSDLQVKGDSLKKIIKLAKQSPVAFAFNPGPKVGDHALFAHRARTPDALAKAARTGGKGKKVAYGRFTIDGNVVTLQCDRQISAVEKELKKYLLAEKLNYSVVVCDGPADGSMPEENTDTKPVRDGIVAKKAAKTEEPASAPRDEGPDDVRPDNKQPAVQAPEQDDGKVSDSHEEAADPDEDAAEAEDTGDLGDGDAYAAYFQKMAKKLKKRQMQFGLGMSSNDPAELRILFHPRQKGKALAGKLIKQTGAKKITWGVSAVKESATELTVEGIPQKTLVLFVHGRNLPGLAKRTKLMLRALGITVLKKVIVTSDGKTIDAEDVDAPEEDDQVVAAGPAAKPEGEKAIPEEPAAEADTQDQDAAEEFAKLKDDINAILSNIIIPTTAPPEQVKALQDATAVLRQAMDRPDAAQNLGKIFEAMHLIMARSANLIGQHRDGGYADVDTTAELQRLEAVKRDLLSMLDGVLVSATTPQAEVRKLAAAVGQLRSILETVRDQKTIDKAVEVVAALMAKSHALFAQNPTQPFLLTDALRIQADWDKLPGHLQRFFDHEKNEMPTGFNTMPGFIEVAHQLEGLSLDDLQGFWRWMHMPAKNMRILKSGVAAYLGILKTRASFGDKVYKQGSETGQTLAQQGDGDPIVAGERIARDFPSLDEATCFARGLGGAAAVMFENGRYVVYTVRLENSETLFGKEALSLSDSQSTGADTEADKAVSEKERELLIKQLEVYGQYSSFASKFGNPALWPMAVIEAGWNLVRDKSIVGVDPKDVEEMKRLELELADLKSAQQNTTKILGGKSNLAALVTEDDYVLRTGPDGRFEVDRDSAMSDPFAPHIRTFGVGLKKCRSREEFERQFELVMRDAAYASVTKAEKATRDLQKRLSASTLDAQDQGALARTLERIAPLDEKVADKERELLIAELKLYGEYADFASKFGNPTLWPLATVKIGWDLVSKKTVNAADPETKAEVNRLQAELNALKAQRSAAAAEFPLALRIPDRTAFAKLGPTEQADLLRVQVNSMIVDIQTTRENIDEGDFDLWTMPGVRDTAMAAVGLEGDQLQWARDKAGWEQKKDTAWAVGEAVVGIGLAVGAAFATGGLALVLGGAALGVGVYGAVDITEDYFRLGSAANVSVDPSKGIVSEDDVPGIGWVIASWVGVGFDALDVLKAAKALKAAAKLKGVADLGQLTKADLDDVAKALKLSDAEVEDYLLPLLRGSKASEFSASVMSEAVFNQKFGTQMSEAVTMIKANGKGGFDIEVVVRAGADPDTRRIAVAEELRHIQQLSDPKFAGDVKLLTEEALANWINKSSIDKAKAYQAQLRLEIDAQQRLVDDLAAKIASETDPDAKALMLAQKVEAESYLADYAYKLDGIKAGLDEGRPPPWVESAAPPRLFNSQSAGKAAVRNLKEMKDVPPPPGYFYTKRADGQMTITRSESQVIAAGENPDTYFMQMKMGPDGKPVFEKLDPAIGRKKARASAAELRQNVKDAFADECDFADLESAFAKLGDKALELDAGAQEYCRAYARKYQAIFKKLADPGNGATAIKPEDILTAKVLKGKSEAQIDSLIRQELRRHILDQIRGADPKTQVKLLTDFFGSSPEPGFHGKLFSEFREMVIPKKVEKVANPLTGRTPNTNEITFKAPGKSGEEGRKIFGDGIVEANQQIGGITRRQGRNVEVTKGPTKAGGQYVAEDKASLAAFKDPRAIKQFQDYCTMIENKLLTSGSDASKVDFDGVVYFFPTAEEAAAALKKMGDIAAETLRNAGKPVPKEGGLSEFIHVAYYEGTNVRWLK